MTIGIHKQIGYAAALWLLLLAVGAAQAAYEQTIETWRAEREAKLKADDGWLTVTGLFWLREGVNEFGADPANDIVLTSTGAPARIGTFDLQGGKVTLRVAEGVDARIGDRAVREAELKPDAAKPSEILQVGDLSFLLLKHGERYGIRLKDRNSAARREFTGLRWFPVREAYRVTARFLPHVEPREVPILNIIGDIEKYKSPGVLKFTLNGQEHTLEPVLTAGDKLFIIFRDQTSGKSTYAASRFLYADPPKNGVVALDFNQAINPPCAFTAYATCPLPPRQNRLPVAIEAGEKDYHGAKERLAAK
jgi:uncharacterized protein (DUF1684 family)